MMPDSLNKPLSDADLEKLEDYLAFFSHSMTVEMLDGFFAALIISPDLVLPSTYMPHVLGEEDHEFADIEEAKDFYGLITRHWNTVTRSLHLDQPYDLVIVGPDDGDSYGNDWAAGFIQGMRLGGAAWDDLLDDDDYGGIFIPIFALAHEHDPDPELRPGPIGEDQRDLMLATIASSLHHVYKYFTKHRQQASIPSSAGQMPVRHSCKKVGRNKPCPCGSLRKYKQCCGKN